MNFRAMSPAAALPRLACREDLPQCGLELAGVRSTESPLRKVSAQASTMPRESARAPQVAPASSISAIASAERPAYSRLWISSRQVSCAQDPPEAPGGPARLAGYLLGPPATAHWPSGDREANPASSLERKVRAAFVSTTAGPTPQAARRVKEERRLHDLRASLGLRRL